MWITTTTISTKLPSGFGLHSGAASFFAVSVSRVVGTSVPLVSHNAPLLSSAIKLNAPATGSASVTVLGQARSVIFFFFKVAFV